MSCIAVWLFPFSIYEKRRRWLTVADDATAKLILKSKVEFDGLATLAAE